jgi:hypothetical protein
MVAAEKLEMAAQDLMHRVALEPEPPATKAMPVSVAARAALQQSTGEMVTGSRSARGTTPQGPAQAWPASASGAEHAESLPQPSISSHPSPPLPHARDIATVETEPTEMSLSDCRRRLEDAEAEEDVTDYDVSTDRSSEIGRLLEQKAMIELCVL